MSKPPLPLITNITNKVQDGEFDRRGISREQLNGVEKEFKEVCKRCNVTCYSPEVEAIDKMIQCLKTNQIRSAKSHAERAQKSIRFCLDKLKTTVSKQTPGSTNKTAPSTGRRQDPPDEPLPDYYNADDNDQMPDRREKCRDSKSKVATPKTHELEQLQKSKDASERLRKDNPNLTDLSDENRPTKLAEKFTELYDNEWTDAFEELQQKCGLRDREAIDCLLEIMKVSYKRSDSEAKSQFADVETEIKRIMIGSQGSKASRPTVKNDNVKGDTSSLKQYLKSLATLSTGGLQKTFEGMYLTDILRRHKCRDQRDLPVLTKFTRKCVELTWLMCVQDPPVILDSLDSFNHFDTNCYKAFTKQGKRVDYYVWPALLLHDGGPLLAKGVAQGM